MAPVRAPVAAVRATGGAGCCGAKQGPVEAKREHRDGVYTMSHSRHAAAAVLLLLMVTALAAGLVALRGERASAQYGDADAPPSDQVQLLLPWNFVTATVGGPVEDVFAGVDAVQAVFRWDAPRTDFDSWQRSAPLASLNSLQVIDAGDAL